MGTLPEGNSERVARMNKLLAAYQSAPKERMVSATKVVVFYQARIERVEHFIEGGEHVFRFTSQNEDNPSLREWKDLPRNVYAIRDEFLRIKKDDPNAVHHFLSNTGQFSPLSNSITMSEFQKWQRFAYLVQERRQLASATKNTRWSGECGEVLKALTGEYSSSFFDEPGSLGETLETYGLSARLLKEHPELLAEIHVGTRFQESVRRELCGWFRNPPQSWEWVPKSPEIEARVMRKLKAGVMIEFLLPRSELWRVTLIQPKYTVQAIAAAIHADFVHGVEWQACDWCGDLVRIRSQRTKVYCGSPRPCKGNAHKQRQRENTRNAVALLTDGLERGLSRGTIESSAKERGIRLTDNAKKQAKEAMLKLRKGAAGKARLR